MEMSMQKNRHRRVSCRRSSRRRRRRDPRRLSVSRRRRRRRPPLASAVVVLVVVAVPAVVHASVVAVLAVSISAFSYCRDRVVVSSASSFALDAALVAVVVAETRFRGLPRASFPGRQRQETKKLRRLQGEGHQGEGF